MKKSKKSEIGTLTLASILWWGKWIKDSTSDADMFARPIPGPAKNLHEYQQRTSTVVTLHAPGNTGPPESHQNYTAINDTPTYGQRTPKRQKKNGTFVHTRLPGSHLNHTGHTPSHEAGTQVQDTPP